MIREGNKVPKIVVLNPHYFSIAMGYKRKTVLSYPYPKFKDQNFHISGLRVYLFVLNPFYIFVNFYNHEHVRALIYKCINFGVKMVIYCVNIIE